MRKGIASCFNFISVAGCLKTLALWWKQPDFFTICREDALEKSTKSELVFWLQRKKYTADALDEEILSINNGRELDQEPCSILKLKNIS